MVSDVIALGGTTIDHVSIVTRTADGWERCQAPLVQGGGLMATAAVAVARLGGSVALWTVVGEDYHGEMARRELVGYGVDVAQVRSLPGTRTRCSYIEVDAETGERTIYLSLVHAYAPGKEEIDFPLAELKTAKSLLVDPVLLSTSIHAARTAREAGVFVVADLNRVDGPIAELVPHVDALIVPEEAGIKVAGKEDYPLALARLADLGPRLPVVTVGARGCWYLAEGHVYHCPAFKVRAVDTTGCGDSFHGAVAYAATRGWGVHESIRFASAVAALKATKLGGRTGLPTLPEVTRFLAARSDEARARRVE